MSITEIPDRWKHSSNKQGSPYEYFKSPIDYQKPGIILEKEVFFSKLKNDYGEEKELERTKKLQEFFDSKIGEALTKLNIKSDVFYSLVCLKFF